MSTIIKFPFKEKEGKYFAPIVSQETTYKVSNGAVVAVSYTHLTLPTTPYV